VNPPSDGCFASFSRKAFDQGASDMRQYFNFTLRQYSLLLTQATSTRQCTSIIFSRDMHHGIARRCVLKAKLYQRHRVKQFTVYTVHCVHEKNCNPVYVAITLANNIGFSEILQHWDVKLQTSHQISAKSVNIFNSYSKFSKVTQSISVHYRRD